jgi:hypothetical protein
MPQINGHATNGHALEPPQRQIESQSSSTDSVTTNGQGPPTTDEDQGSI